MKKREGKVKNMKQQYSFLVGFLCGAILFSTSNVFAANLLAEPTTQAVYVNGEKATIMGYNIQGYNYFQLRELGKELDFLVQYDDKTDCVNIRTDQSYGAKAANMQVPENHARQVVDVSVKRDESGRPMAYEPTVGSYLYGTGNVAKSVNPYATEEYDGYMEIKEFSRGTAFPNMPLGTINKEWDPSYYDIVMPNPVPCYTSIHSGQVSDFMGVKIADETGSKTMYVFNAKETQRIIDELYNTFLEHPECYTNGRLNCTVAVGLTDTGFNGNFFYPYRDVCVEQTVHDRNVDYLVYALDTYENGVYNGTKYICQENCSLDHEDVISSEHSIIKDRQE